MSFSIDIEARGFKEAAQMLDGVKNGFGKAVSKSINSSLLAGRTRAAKLIRAKYNIKAAEIKDAFTMRKATQSHLEGELEYKGSMLPLAAFNPRVKLEKSGKTKRLHQHVYAAIVKGGKKKLIKGAFQIPKGRFMERRQPEREPIFPVSVIGIPHMVGSLKIKPEVEERMRQAYDTALHYNVNFYLDKEANKSRRFKA